MLNIFVTNLGKYNEGHLIGEWVDLPVSEDELQAVYDRIGINEYYEEVFITDYETDIPGLKVGEYDSISDLNDFAEQLEDLGDDEKDVIGALISEGYSLEDALDKKDDCYIYYNVSDMADVAEQYCDEIGILDAIPDSLRNYFDFEAFGRDMSFEGNFVFTDGGNCVEIL